MIWQIAQEPGQVHFRVSGLQATLQRGLESVLNLGVARARAEEIRIATKVLDGHQSRQFPRQIRADHLFIAVASSSRTPPSRRRAGQTKRGDRSLADSTLSTAGELTAAVGR
jgi:hypothetical protein